MLKVSILPFVEKTEYVAAENVSDALLRESYGFFLDSSSTDSGVGRYSFVGADPFLVFKSQGDFFKIETPPYGGRTGAWARFRTNPFEVLRGLLEKYRLTDSFPIPLVGGAVGFFSYDLGRFLEHLPDTAQNDLNLPDCALGFYDTVFIFDHLLKKGYIASTGMPETGNKAVERAKKRLAWAQAYLDAAGRKNGEAKSGAELPQAATLKSNFSRDDYLKVIATAKEYIAAGDIYQVNLSQRFEKPMSEEPWSLYRRLRRMNPAPFAAFLNFPEVQVISSSPERFLKVTGRRVETRPIKGTRPRGQNREQDRAMAKALVQSAKDQAEHVMIVDLERNDIGRVCEVGSVSVPQLANLESFATVHHLVSTVTGILKTGADAISLLTASFPGGSITGAPKIRAMEIIEELEPTKRSIYTGAIGYLSFNGDMDVNIAIRTAMSAQGKLYFQVGGGIVSDSDPEAEYQETLDKGRALIEATGRF